MSFTELRVLNPPFPPAFGELTVSFIRDVTLIKKFAEKKRMKPTDRTPRSITDALMLGGYLPDFDLTLRLGRDLLNEWMNAYQDVQITNTFKKILRRNLNMPMPSDV